MPSGFKLVEKPTALPTALPTDINGLFIFLLFPVGWDLGKFIEYKPNNTKFKYTITYNDGSRPTQLKLENYDFR